MRENQVDESMEIDLLELIQVLWKKAWIIVLCLLVGAVGMGGYTKLTKAPTYQATTTLYVLSGQNAISVGDLQLGMEVSQDFIELARSKTTLENTISKAGLSGKVSVGELAGGVSVVSQEGTHFMKLSVTNTNPKYAVVLANTLAEEAIDRVVTVMNAEKPSISEKAEVAPQVGPPIMKNILMGGAVGAALAMAVILLLYFMDDRIKDEDDVRKYLNVNVLAALPDTKESRRKKVISASVQQQDADIEIEG